MANIVQTENFSARTFPFKQSIPYGTDVYGQATVPWGQGIVDAKFSSDAVAAGNTATLALDIALPRNYCCLLRSLHLDSYGTTTQNWTEGLLGLAYQSPGGPYAYSMAAMPEDEYLWWVLSPNGTVAIFDRTSTLKNVKRWTISGQSSHAITIEGGLPLLDDPSRVPLWIPPGDTGLVNRSVIVYVKNGSPGSSANNFRLNAVFDLYTFEQAYASGVMSSPRVL